MPTHSIQKIKYFTAIVIALPHDLNVPLRQAIYLRALRTLSDLEIHKGHFVQWPRLLPQYPLAYIDTNNPTMPPQKVQALRAEEKGSDVNLASLFLRDCFENDFDEAVVISNDSDLTVPVEIVVKDYGKPVKVINPHRKKYLSHELKGVASSCIYSINMSAYGKSQFPPTMTDSNGTFSKPATW